jgi:hypothetical protein
VRSAELLASDELQLAHPSATETSSRGDDEGVGTGFDNQFPDAYADRWFTVAEDPESVLDWWAERIEALGWIDVTSDADREPRDYQPVADTIRMRVFSRDEEGRLGVTAFDDRIRVHLRITGKWPDGSSGPRAALGVDQDD